MTPQSIPDFALLEGVITHHRYDRYAHDFNHRQFWMVADLDVLDNSVTEKTHFKGLWPWMGVQKSSLYQFKAQDHLPDKTGRPLKEKILAAVNAAGIGTEATQNIQIICHWRYANYTFNPVSLFYGLNSAGDAQWCLVEVENTFYERKTFVIPNTGTLTSPRFEATCPKYFYVSPFFRVDDTFRLSLPASPTVGEPFGMSITTLRDDVPILTATFQAHCKPLTSSSIRHCLFRYPFMPLQVIVGIHLHALRLWLKGVPFAQKEAFLAQQQAVWNPKPPLCSSRSSQL
jgi:DUF1365 family protein